MKSGYVTLTVETCLGGTSVVKFTSSTSKPEALRRLHKMIKIVEAYDYPPKKRKAKK